MNTKTDTQMTSESPSCDAACCVSLAAPEAVAHALKRRQRGNPPHPEKTVQLCVIIDARTQDDLAEMLEIMADKMREPDQLDQVGGVGGYASTCSWATIQVSPHNADVLAPAGEKTSTKQENE
jgi:hypothetical protein